MISLTDRAASKIVSKGKKHIYLYLEKGGCAEYKYCFAFTEPGLSCTSFSVGEIEVRIPEQDLEKLSLVEIDYESNLLGEKFIIARNPYVTEKCSCGISIKGGK
jgi:iron-sulfur cluster assembly accessory protein